MTDAGYKKIEVIVRNVPKTFLFNCCGYVIENGQNVTYLNYEIADSKAATISYDFVLGL